MKKYFVRFVNKDDDGGGSALWDIIELDQTPSHQISRADNISKDGIKLALSNKGYAVIDLLSITPL